MPRYNDPARSKSARAAQALRRMIREAPLGKGDRLPGEADLADELAVSRWTIRRATQQLVREGILESQPGIGHVVRKRNAAPTIGLLLNHTLFARTVYGQPPLTPFAVLLFNALRAELRRRRCNMRLYLPEVDAVEHRMDHARLQRDLARGRFAGLITTHWPHRADKHPPQTVRADEQLTDALRAHGIPIAGLSGRDLPHAVTGTDYYAAGYMGAQYFLERGIARIGLLGGEEQPRSFTHGFRDAMREAGAPVREPWVMTAARHSEAEGYEHYMQRFAGTDKPAALLVDDDALGKGAMIAATADPAAPRFACHAIAGSSMFMPQPHVKLEFDAAEYAHDVVGKLLRMMRDPSFTPGRTWIQPRIVEPQHDAFGSFVPSTTADLSARVKRAEHE